MDEDFWGRTVVLVTLVGTGLLLLWMARAAADGRLKRNQWAGIRIPSTMASDEAWLAGHRAAETPTRWAGWVAIVSGFLALFPISMGVVAAGAGVASVVLLGLVLHGARLAGRAARSTDQ